MKNNFNAKVKMLIESICLERFLYDNERVRNDYEFEQILDFIDDIPKKDRYYLAIDYKYDNFKNENFTMIKYEGNIIGFLYKDKKLVDMLYIDPKYRNKGIGTDVIKNLTKPGSIAKTKVDNKIMAKILKKNNWEITDKNSETITWKNKG